VAQLFDETIEQVQEYFGRVNGENEAWSWFWILDFGFWIERSLMSCVLGVSNWSN
jgi:hypothetical protein